MYYVLIVEFLVLFYLFLLILMFFFHFFLFTNYIERLLGAPNIKFPLIGDGFIFKVSPPRGGGRSGGPIWIITQEVAFETL
jgi:hypothetical protein